MNGNGGIVGVANFSSSTVACGVWRPSYIAHQLASQRTVPGVFWPGPADAHFSVVSLLCHFDADITNRGTGVAITAAGGAGLSTAQRTILPYSGFVSSSQNSTGRFDSVSNAAYNYAAGDFTLELWVYLTANTAGVIWDQRPAATNGLYPALYIASAGNVNYYVNSADRITGTGALVTVNAWHHIAVSRVSGTTKLFIDGVQNGSSYTDGNTYLQGPIALGGSSFTAGSSSIAGYIQEPRASKYGRYASGFTPSTLPFPDY